MTSRLPDSCEKVTWRIRTADLELLRILFPGRVNDTVRDLLGQYCDHIREAGRLARSTQDERSPDA